MAADALAAARAYADAARQAAQNAQPAPAQPTADGPDFGAMVIDAVQQTQSSLASAETLTQQAALGQAELVDVATAVAAAEVSLETVVTLRDQVVQAYQEILRMPI
ncbi:MAG: flagellar hook-basal body complex protein FliE [Maricaulaceae bacterium]|jgi:flagellar hook-basal body complex protein FliE